MQGEKRKLLCASLAHEVTYKTQQRSRAAQTLEVQTLGIYTQCAGFLPSITFNHCYQAIALYLECASIE